MEFDKDVLNALRSVPDTPDEEYKLAVGVQSKKHSKPKKKDSSFLYGNEVAEILKSTNSPEQKLTMVCNKYSEMMHANRKLMMAYKMSEGRIAKLQQENEQSQQQRSKAVLARSRLENLCRELQKLNKAQKEEIDLKLRLEEEKRKEISATFQSAFAEMNTLTNQNTEKNTKMREENLEMREKIKSVRERIELSEQQLEKVRQQAQLELQLAEAKMATVKMEMTAEKECLLKEKQQLLLKLTEYQVRISELQATEVGLRSQISMYTEKYDDFQNALTKSNEVFSGFNEEMEKMSKKILKLEKETSLWKQRWEKSHAALLDMAADKQARDTEMSKLTHKLSLLQELCKAFQRERTELLAQLRAANGHATTGDHHKVDNVDIKQVEELSKDCQQLKDDLAQLQGSLTDVIVESNDEQVTKDVTLESTKLEVSEPSVVENIASNESQESVESVATEIKVTTEDTNEQIETIEMCKIPSASLMAVDKSADIENSPTNEEIRSETILIETENKNSTNEEIKCVTDNLAEDKSENLTINPVVSIDETPQTTEEVENVEKNNTIIDDKKEVNKQINSNKKGNGKRKKK